MRLSETRKELAGWAALFGKEYDPEVFVRVGNSKRPLTCMEVGDLSQHEGITLGNWEREGIKLGEWDDVEVEGEAFVDPSMS